MSTKQWLSPKEIPKFDTWLNQILNRDILPFSVLLNIWCFCRQQLGGKYFWSDPYVDAQPCQLSLVLNHRLSFREILTESRPRRHKDMQASCNKAINTSVFPWFFFVLRSSSYLERHQHSKLAFPTCGVAGVEGGGQLQFAGALVPAQNHDPNKPPSVMQWLRVSDGRGRRRTESPNAEIRGTGTVNFSYVGPNSVSPDKVCMFLILLLPERILEDFQVLQPPEKFVCLFSCMQIGKAVIQRYTMLAIMASPFDFPSWENTVS